LTGPAISRTQDSYGAAFPRIGRGRSIAQHGELFQGQIEEVEGSHRRCLVSLPCKALYSEAILEADRSGVLAIAPAHKCKAKKVMELTREHLGAGWLGGSVRITSTIAEAKGYGSSTADCIASAIAVADAIGKRLREEELARLVVQAEVASDNFMFEHAVLFAHREGVVLENYARHVPALEVLGIDTAEECHVATLEYPPAAYSWRQRQSFCTLAGALRRAICKHDVKLLGRVATASACINEHFLPKRMFKDIKRIVEYVGALGMAVAHSGTVMSILFDPSEDVLEPRIDQTLAYLRELGVSKVIRFQT
jgi:uncharacterized protein involved in propanediol utilization